MKTSQILYEVAEKVSDLADAQDNIIFYNNIYACLIIKDKCGADSIQTAEAIHYYKLFASQYNLDMKVYAWFSDYRTYPTLTTKDLNEMRVLALLFAAAIAESEGN